MRKEGNSIPTLPHRRHGGLSETPNRVSLTLIALIEYCRGRISCVGRIPGDS